MQRLFGLPVGTLTTVLTALLVGVVVGLAVMALRNRIFFKLGVRNMSRRRGRSAVIVAGLMLATAIIATALGTGDTMASTVRSSVITSLGNTDEVVSARSADTSSAGIAFGPATGVRYLSGAEAATIEAAASRSRLVDGVAPAISEPVAVQDVSSRRNEPRVTLFGTDPSAMAGFGTIRGPTGEQASLAALGPGDAYLNRVGADELSARPGDLLRIMAAGRVSELRIAGIVSYDGTGTDSYALLVPLTTAQRLLGVGDQVQEVLISNVGDALGGATHTGAVQAALAPTADRLGLQTHPVKQDGLELADKQGASFLSLFTTFGTFTISAGILLIFLIFVMLAAERRSEMGTARAVGTQRGHLVRMFVFEGMAYDLVAAAVGAVLGLGIALGMVQAIGAALASSGLHIRYSFRVGSLLLSYSIGVLLTLVVVTASAWRVSRLNVVSAIRNLPEPPRATRPGARWLVGLGGVVLGGLLVLSGASSGQAGPFLGGVGLALISLVPVARAIGLSDRAAHTVAGGALLVWCLLPLGYYRALVPGLTMDFSVWVLVGLLLVVGATWVVIYNASLLLGGLTRLLGQIRALAPVIKAAVAHPLRSRFRTGTTIALFTLVVFTLVVGSTTSNAFMSAMNDEQTYNGGFQIRAQTAPTSPITDMGEALRRAPGIQAGDITGYAAQSSIPVEVRQGSTGSFQPYVLNGFDRAFTDRTTYAMAAMARGYHSARDVWAAVASHPGLAVVDSLVVPRRSNFGFAVLPKFRLHGLYLEDEVFDPVHLQVQNPQTGGLVHLTVIGILKETAPLTMAGIATSQSTVASFGPQASPGVWYFNVARGVDPVKEAARLESAFLANGMQAKALSALLHDAVSTGLTFQWLILGFLGLGLIIGVAALGVISARAVVERRQQIGIMRAIGFQRGMVQLSFLLESSFVTLVGIGVGTTLGLLTAYNIITDTARQPSWDNLRFAPPLVPLVAILLTVFVASLATTYLPARRASRIYPAAALRYQ